MQLVAYGISSSMLFNSLDADFVKMMEWKIAPTEDEIFALTDFFGNTNRSVKALEFFRKNGAVAFSIYISFSIDGANCSYFLKMRSGISIEEESLDSVYEAASFQLEGMRDSFYVFDATTGHLMTVIRPQR